MIQITKLDDYFYYVSIQSFAHKLIITFDQEDGSSVCNFFASFYAVTFTLLPYLYYYKIAQSIKRHVPILGTCAYRRYIPAPLLCSKLEIYSKLNERSESISLYSVPLYYIIT